MLKDHLQQITNGISYSQTHETVMLMGHFNGEISDTIVGSFCAIDKLKSLIKETICYKNPENRTSNPA